MLSRLRVVALNCVVVYVCGTAISIAIAHILSVAEPKSGLGERIIAPVAASLTFLDAHWKAVLLLISPFVAPAAKDLIPRLRKVGSLEFDPVQLDPIGVREKPKPTAEGIE